MITPTEHIQLKEECRKRGLEVYSIFSYNTENAREESTVRDIIFLSTLNPKQVLEVAIFYFKGLGYKGKVSIRQVGSNTYTAVLEKRLKY